MAKLTTFFEEFLEKGSLFANKRVLQSNFIPTEIEHRDDQINNVANILAPALRLERPSNLFIYGKTGTGKTLVAQYTAEKMMQVAKERDIPLKVFYLNCKLKKIADTEYRLIAELARHLGKAIPPTGLPTDEVYNIFFNALDSKKQIVIFILDEIDQLVKKAGDEIIYNLTRINSELKNAQVGIIGVSNDLIFSNNLDPRVKSSLSEEELVFPPYNALQIQSILKKRCGLAFHENVLDDGVIAKCAAFAAREHGDARRALELMRVAGELAERANKENVNIKHLDEAEEKIERDRFLDVVEHQPKQFQATLFSILAVSEKTSSFFTGEIYDYYKRLCSKVGLRPLTQRRVSDILAELDMLGLINAKVISKGRFGRTREMSVNLPKSLLPQINTTLQDGLGL
ncbi:ORC1-type DNA replication protein [Candidatus Woesearchaeota archaeon]|nr:ORC1-type DNA replication protein [Candidatus Woesearchaeota archaeon]